MSAPDLNGRTHEPSLRELTSDLDGLRELLLAKIESLQDVFETYDKLYTERDNSRRTAVEAALKAAETLTNASFAASEKAIQKADTNAEKWRENANEWRAAMVDREVKFASRVEVEAKFQNMADGLISLKESRAEYSGGHLFKADARSTVAMFVGVIGLIAALVMALIK